ncbi:hypothetical protein UlMin_041578 [Ulmus minor]
MGELEPLSLSLQNSSLRWDFHHNLGLGVLNTDTMSLVMDSNNANASSFLSSPEYSDDFSTGYLEDALVEFSERSKRRRLLLNSDEEQLSGDSNLLAKGYWNSNWELSENFNFMNQMAGFNELLSGGPITTSICRIGEETNMVKELKSPEEAKSISNESSSSSSYKENLFHIDPPSGCFDQKKKKKRVNITRVVYPFALVKPGGIEGDVTLNDINERILMPPTRPVRHPVGDFACRPCVSPHGPGLSGKAVVAFTRIQTQGSGTITIIRTKG